MLHRRQGTNYKDKKKVLGARQGAVRGLYDGQDCIVHQQLAGGEWVLERRKKSVVGSCKSVERQEPAGLLDSLACQRPEV